MISDAGLAEPCAWSIPYLQRVCSQPGGREAVEKHVLANLKWVDNGNDPLMVTNTWNGKHFDHSVSGASRVLNGLKQYTIEFINDEVARLESEVANAQATVEQLEQSVKDARGKRHFARELRVKKRALSDAQARLDAERLKPMEQTTLHAVVKSTQKKMTFNNLVFRPGGDALPDDFNMFRGYAVERLLEEYPDRYPDAASPMFDHIKDVLCAGDQQVYDYVLKFIAHILNNPTDKCGVALLLYSKPGAGKNVLFTFLEAIVGAALVASVQDDRSLTGEFNAHRANKLLILANELKNGGVACKDANILNSMITDKTDHIRCLGKDRQRIESVSSLMMFTNERRSVRIGPDDRRYCAIECSDAKIGDTTYFANLVATIDDPKARVEFFRQVREIDIKGFHFGSNIPQTPYRTFLQRAPRDETTPVVYTYLAERVCQAIEWSDRELRFTAADFTSRLAEWMTNKGIRGADSLNVIAVSKQLHKLGFSATQTKIAGLNTRRYNLVSSAKIVEALQREGVGDSSL